MKKIVVLCIVAIIFPMFSSAHTLMPAEALDRAVSSDAMKARSLAPEALSLVYTATTVTDNPAVYVFENKAADGYVLVGADDVAAPLLGYVDAGTFDYEQLPPQLKWWLAEYARQIEYASQCTAMSASSMQAQSLGPAVAPMIKTKWSQGKPYNDKCPEYQNQRTVTGCVATAMAQVMNYWRWPQQGKGKITYTASSIKQTLSMDFSSTVFDWNSMLDTYDNGYSLKNSVAVSTLMKACGYSVMMNYGVNASGAQSMSVANALVKYFGYNINITYQQRDYYSPSEWYAMVYDEVKNGRPVLYSGTTLDAGHEFVCDGYDGNGMFHFNWGWGGMSDGYYALDALAPGAQGTGGGTGGFKFYQDVLIGVSNESTPQAYAGMLLDGGVKAEVQDKQIVVTLTEEGWLLNSTYKAIAGSTGFIITPKAGGEPRYIECWRFEMSPNTGYNGYSSDGTPNVIFNLTLPDDLAAGDYNVTFACRYDGSEEWVPVKAASGFSGSFALKKSDSSLSVVNSGFKSLTISSCTVSEIIKDIPTKFKVTVRNNTDVELSQCIYPVLLKDGALKFQAEGIMVSLKPGEEYQGEWYATFNPAAAGINVTTDTSFTFELYDPSTGYEYNVEKIVMMKINKGNIALEISNPKIENANQQYIYMNGSDRGTNGYLVTDPSDIQLNFNVRNTGTAVFGHPLVVGIFPYDSGTVSAVDIWDIEESIILNPGEWCTCKESFSFESFSSDMSYFLTFYYLYNGSYVNVADSRLMFKVDVSGVSDAVEGPLTVVYDPVGHRLNVRADSEIADVEIYSAAGIKALAGVDRTATGAVVALDGLVSGIYFVVATDTAGHRQTLTIAVH